MDAFLKRANEADDLLKTLTSRVEALEKNGPAQVGKGVLVDPDSEMMTEKARNKVRAMVMELKGECDAMTKEKEVLQAENKKLKTENKKLKAQMKKGGLVPSGKIEQQMQKTLQDQQLHLNPLKKVVTSLKKWRNDVVALQAERDTLKKQVDEAASSGSMNPDMINNIREKLVSIRAEVVKYMKKQGAMEETVAGSSNKLKMTMETIQDLKFYNVTTDLAELKKEWAEAELGELDDEDFEIYLGREVRVIEIEDDDDTINVRFDNHSSQWFPVGCLYKTVECAAESKPAPAASSGLVQMTMDTIKERKYYFVTTDLAHLKADWEKAELGELDDEDFEVYLGRKVYAIDLEEDDDTMNVRFDSHDTQWFPVSCLYMKLEEGSAAAPAKKSSSSNANPGRTQMTMDTIKERKHYYVTKDLAELKKAWYEAELGELDDEDFEIYLNRKVYAIDLEEDDDTMNVRFDNHDTQWFPVSTLYSEGAGSSSPNGSKKQMSMDTIKERKYYYVTKDLTELKKAWAEAELGELDDEDFEIYLNRKVYAIDLEEDDDTMNVRFDNHDTQWFPVTTLYQE